MQNEQNVVEQTKFLVGKPRKDAIPEPQANPDKYLVYPENDGTDRPRNPYSSV